MTQISEKNMRKAEQIAVGLSGFLEIIQVKSNSGFTLHATLIKDKTIDYIGITLQQRDDMADKLAEALRFAAEKFRWYEQLHAAKPDIEKAKRNAEFAEVCEEALAQYGKAKG